MRVGDGERAPGGACRFYNSPFSPHWKTKCFIVLVVTINPGFQKWDGDGSNANMKIEQVAEQGPRNVVELSCHIVDSSAARLQRNESSDHEAWCL